MGKKKRKAKPRIKFYQQDIDCHVTRQLDCGCLKLWVYDRGYFKAAGYEEMCVKHQREQQKEWVK